MRLIYFDFEITSSDVSVENHCPMLVVIQKVGKCDSCYHTLDTQRESSLEEVPRTSKPDYGHTLGTGSSESLLHSPHTITYKCNLLLYI